MTRTKSTYLALVAVLLSPMAANADPIIISTSIGDYEVEVIEGPTADLTDIFQEQVWYDNEALALEFAGLVLKDLGPVNLPYVGFSDGPYFVWNIDFAAESFTAGGYWFDVGVFNFSYDFGEFAYATAKKVSVPEPGTLALLGIGLLGMGATRRRKKA